MSDLTVALKEKVIKIQNNYTSQLNQLTTRGFLWTNMLSKTSSKCRLRLKLFRYLRCRLFSFSSSNRISKFCW